MTFVEIEQDGKVGYINANHVVLVLPSQLVGTAQLVTINGMALNVKGSVQEIRDRLENGDGPAFKF